MVRCLSLVAALGLAGFASASELTESLKKGTPELKSATQLAFGPEGILFVGDATGATVFAIDTADTKAESKAAVKVENLPEEIGAALGAMSGDIKINDLKVNPASGNLFLAVTRGTMPVIVKPWLPGTSPRSKSHLAACVSSWPRPSPTP